jgi:hydrogenase nickel incorporation protein HypA/HybF
MHELSLAQSIVEIVQQYAPDHQGKTVKSVKLKVGELAGVVVDSLDFCFAAITAGTPLQGVALEFERVPFTLRCNNCGKSFESEYGVVVCPECGVGDTKVVGGTEMQVVEIEVDDHVSS